MLDTNVLISALLTPTKTAGQTLRVCRRQEIDVLFSETTFAELATRLFRSKFDRYATVLQRTAFLRSIHELAVFEHPTQEVNDCRDPDDNKFLALAVVGEADIIVAGDNDLLLLNPYDKVKIITPAKFLGVTH